MFSPSVFHALQQQPDVLAEVAALDLRPAQTLAVLTRLRKNYPADIAAAALETTVLRQKAIHKFSRADQMFLTSDALQQATHEVVAQYHARLLAPFTTLADLGCSIGGDLIHMAQQADTVGIDRDPVRLLMARHNVRVYGAAAEVVQADLTRPLPLHQIEAAFFDPARRDESRRIFSVQDYMPPLDQVLSWPFRAVLVKISPGVQLEELAHLPCGIEFVSYAGDLKEALLHLGDLRFAGLRATCLPDGGTLYPQQLDAPPVIDQPRRYLYEPDPAVIRAGLFGELLAHLKLEAYRLDETIAYLTGDEPINTPWLRWWSIDAWLPFNLKKLRSLLAEAGVGSVTVKKRGSPITPEELQKQLKLKKGERHAVVTLTRLQGQPIVLISYSASQPMN